MIPADTRRSLERLEPTLFAILRIVIGVLFACHALPKLFGIFGHKVEVGHQMWIGGIIELTTGTLIALGFYAREAAFLAAGQMAVAYFQFHVGHEGQLLPVQNGGDAAVLYCFFFLLVFLRGPGRFAMRDA